MKRNPYICLLVTVCLVASLTAQAAAAFRVACQGEASCCCQPAPAMHAMPTDTASMGAGCCGPSPSRACDLKAPLAVPAVAFLPVENNVVPDISLALGSLALADADPDGGGFSDRIPIRPPTSAGPPVYLRNQSFLY